MKRAALAGALVILLPGVAGLAEVPISLRVGITRAASYDIVTLPLETYVARVLAGESAPGSTPAALEALAIAIRTYTVVNMSRHRADGFDLCDQTHCQVLRAATPATERAAQVTSGEILLYKGAPASIYYSASCGGHTERPSEVWPGADDPPYLPSRDDSACEGEPAWTTDISTADLERTLTAAGFRGSLRSLRIAARDRSGRVSRVVLDGLAPGEISGTDLRTQAGRTLGPLAIRSAIFDVTQTAGTYRFSGRGFGHGVGMCVMGSVKLGAAGETAAAILNRYFPGTTISRSVDTPLAPAVTTSVLVSLPDGDEGERRGLMSLVASERDEVARTLGVQASPVTVRIHATTSEYERTTGQPWFTAGAVVSTEVHLTPLASLRARGVLERTIRRELVHVMADRLLAERPAWVRTGAALFFSDPGDATPSGSRASCPKDDELFRPASAGALSDAYRRARDCFARQIMSGRSWQDVR